MKETNRQADAMTRAAQIAVRELKQKLRDDGCRATDERMYGLRTAIGDHLAKHPEIVERATAEVSSWRKNGSHDTAEKKRSINPLT